MSDIFQIASVGLLEGRQRLEAISQNAASATLPGYRRHVATAGAFDAALAGPEAATSTEVARSLPHGNLQFGVDLKSGAMIATGRALDVAIDAQDLFFALTDGTQTWLTRAGSFHVNEEGVLVGERGLRVVGTQGDVRLPGNDVTVEADGRITHQGLTVAALQLFQPSNQASLIASQGALLVSLEGIQPAEAGAGRIRGGTLEASNTDASREMLGLVAISRQFESLSRVLQGYDEALGRAIQKLGEV